MSTEQAEFDNFIDQIYPRVSDVGTTMDRIDTERRLRPLWDRARSSLIRELSIKEKRIKELEAESFSFCAQMCVEPENLLVEEGVDSVFCGKNRIITRLENALMDFATFPNVALTRPGNQKLISQIKESRS